MVYNSSKRKLDEIYIIIFGDVNCDGFIDTADKVLISNYLSGKASLTNTQYVAADVDHDGTVTSADMVAITRMINNISEYEQGFA